MKTRFPACLFLPTVFLLALFLVIPAWARSHSHPAKAPAQADPGYGFALAAANHFLHAWQTGDAENGMVLLSDPLRHSQNADKLEDFFSGGKDRAFEIARGRGRVGHYSFPVVLVTFRSSRVTRKLSEIVLI